MSIAINDDLRQLEAVAREFLSAHDARSAGRALLESEEETLPPFWDDLTDLGWLGLHLPEEYEGSGFGLPELVVVVEALGRAVAPGPFVPTVCASAVLDDLASAETRARFLTELATGEAFGAVGLGGSLTHDGNRVSGDAGTVLGAGLARLLVLAVGDDLVVVEARKPGVTIEVPANVDPTRRSARVRLENVEAEDVLAGARPRAQAIVRTIVAAEATGGARESLDMATEYAKVRQQFGRPIAMFQAVKHHLANMLVAAELATAATWDAARAATGPGDQFELAGAVAGVLAIDGFAHNADMSIQIHGGIGFTWEHDAHLLLRRATALAAIYDSTLAAEDIVALTRAGVKREFAIDLPPEADAIREEVRAFATDLAALDPAAQRTRLIETGYVMPHWPKPWGRAAGAVEQLVIDEEFSAAGVKRPQYGITGWVILTLIQHGTAEQIERWVHKTLTGEYVWCQLFSEPDAGSDAAGVKTRGKRVEGGWLITGQKVWTSGAHYSHRGLVTVRTDPDAPKHAGITTVVVDMHAPGVEVRPLRQITGQSDFNEVFFDDVFVPDDDVVGPPNDGWTVARATLGNERVSIGGGAGGLFGFVDLLALEQQHGDRLPGAVPRIGRLHATEHAQQLLNLRRAERAVAGAEPGPEGNVTKLVLAETGHERAFIAAALSGPDTAFTEGAGAISAMLSLAHRAMSIAGGTSEITRNQIGERILGLPRDPLLK
jgi:alkylation response protein AidB-like acyl-CoA dehydrogenase